MFVFNEMSDTSHIYQYREGGGLLSYLKIIDNLHQHGLESYDACSRYLYTSINLSDI